PDPWRQGADGRTGRRRAADRAQDPARASVEPSDPAAWPPRDTCGPYPRDHRRPQAGHPVVQQYLAHRRAGPSADRRGPEGLRGARALARLPDPRPLALRAGTLRRTPLPEVPDHLQAPATALASYRASRPRARQRGPDHREKRIQPGEAPRFRPQARDGGFALLPARPAETRRAIPGPSPAVFPVRRAAGKDQGPAGCLPGDGPLPGGRSPDPWRRGLCG